MRNACGPEIGSSYRFLPSAFKVNGENPMALPFTAPESLYITGKVVQIHEEHHWFRVEYQSPCGTMHECFKY